MPESVGVAPGVALGEACTTAVAVGRAETGGVGAVVPQAAIEAATINPRAAARGRWTIVRR